MALRLHGFEVAAAGTGQEALDQVRAFRPHLVVLDVMLPDVEGFEVAERLGAQRADVPRRGPAGAGLGLAIVRAVVAAHDGTVHAETRPEGGARGASCKMPSVSDASDPPLCPSCGQPGSAALAGAEHGWECRNEACPEFGQALQEHEPPPVDAPDPGRQGP